MKILLISGLTTLSALFSANSISQCQADYNNDGTINSTDVSLFLGDYELGPNCVQCDLNNDGNVDQQDISLIQGYTGANCATIPPVCQADYSSDGLINLWDLTLFQVDFAQGQNCTQCDLNGDGIVSNLDGQVFQGIRGTLCPNTQTACQGDYDNDGMITNDDLALFWGDYAAGQNCIHCDMNNNGIVEPQDVTTFQGLIGTTCAAIPTNCPADYNGDGFIDITDLSLFADDYALGQNCVQCDINGDGIISQNDALLINGLFGTSCTPAIVGCPGDYNNDGTITAEDLSLFQGDYALGQNCAQCDMNHNGIVDQQDVTTFQGLLGSSCETIPSNCPADYTGDGIINSSDLTLFLGDYALGQNCVQCDLNGDGIVSQLDATLFQGLYETTCTSGATGCPGDYTNDGVINASDLTLFLGDYALGQNCVQCDLNSDGIVNTQDNTLFQGLFGTFCATIPTDCPADYNGDGTINASDLTLFQDDYILGQNCIQCDLNGDGTINQQDVSTFQGLFGTSCSGSTPTCIGDYDGDGVITSADNTLFLIDHALGANCVQCDINGDGIVNSADVIAFKAIFGTNCPQPNLCPDYNGNGYVTAGDLSLFLADYSLGSNCVMCDINGDGVVGQQDSDFFVSLFGTTCVKQKNLSSESIRSMQVDMVMYPNPTSDAVNIVLNNGAGINAESSLEVLDLAGRVIENPDISTEQGVLTLSVEAFESGTYFIFLSTNGQQYKSKLIVK